MEVSNEEAAAAARPNLGERGISSSQTLSSGLHVQSELVNEIAQLRSALSQANNQLERAQAAGYVNRSVSPPGQSAVLSSIRPRDRRSTLPAGLGLNIKHSHQQNGMRQQQQHHQQSHASDGQRHRRVSSTTTARSSLNGTTSPPATVSNPTTRAASATAMNNNNNMQTTPMRSNSRAGYLGAPPSSLAVVSTPPTSASTLEFSLKRNLAYDNLAGVSNAPSPRPPALQPRRSSAASSSGLGISSPPPHTRNTSLSGTPTSSSSLKANMSVIPQGSVGTATTLAGGSNSNSPRTPQFQSEERSASSHNNDTPSRASKQQNKDDIPSNVLRDTTNGAVRESKYGGVSDEVMDKLTSSSAATLSPPPPIQGHQKIDTLLSANGSPNLSSDGEYSPATTATTMEDMEDDIMVRLPMRKHSKASAGASARGGSSPFFGGSAGFTERHGERSLYFTCRSVTYIRRRVADVHTVFLAAARIASSQSGTSKVIMSLQTELTNSRTQLESTRTQLRASARAVESLTRQIEDLKEGKERSRLELQGLTTTLTRRERMLEETLSRARTAESNSKTLEEEKKLHYSDCTRKMKELEIKFKEADEKRLKMESEYNALRSATNGLSDGWRKELKSLKKELASAKLGGEQARNDARTRQQSGESCFPLFI
jgi:hypothetical protein